MQNRVFLNLGFGEPRFWTSDSRGFRRFRGFVIFAAPATDPLVCGSLSCLRHFRGFRRFREKNRIAKHRFSKT